MAVNKIKDIFHYEREEMHRVVRWLFGLPLVYSLYLTFSLLIPSFGSSDLLLLLRNAVSYAILTFCIIFVVRRFIKFDLRLFFTETLYFNFRKLFVGFATMLILGLNTSFIWMALEPSEFAFTLSGNPVANWLLGLVLVFLAALSEELIFRAYLAHFLQDKLEQNKKHQLIYCLVSGLLFSFSHLANPELSVSFIVPCLFYFIMGFALMSFVFTTGGIEFSLGIHIANNLIVAWFFNYPDSVVKTNALFTQYSAISPMTLIKLAICLFGCSIIARKMKSC